MNMFAPDFLFVDASVETTEYFFGSVVPGFVSAHAIFFPVVVIYAVIGNVINLAKVIDFYWRGGR